MKKLDLPNWSVPAALFVACLVSYGLLMPWLGFYWDDWNYLYSYHVFGPLGYQAFVAGDRPFSQYIYILTTALFGTWPFAYHILNLLLRWGTATALWWALGEFWPGRSKQLVWVPFLFAVYPGFGQQPIPLIYSLHWANYLQTILSLGLMARSLREANRRKFWLYTGAAVVLSLNVFSLEYYFGLELVRPLLIWLILGERMLDFRQRVWAAARYWVPYLLVGGAYILWRVVLFHSNMYQPEILENLTQSPQHGLLGLAQTVGQDFFKVCVFVWGRVFNSLQAFNLDTRTNLLYWGVVGLGVALAALYFFRLQKNNSEAKSWTGQVILVGAFAILTGGIPFWSSGLAVEQQFPYDRFTLPFIFGVSLLLGGLMEWIVRTERQKILLIALALGFAAGWHFQNENSFRRDWDNMKTFVWQLTWRMPGLQPGTMVMTHDLPLNYYSDYSLTSPLNMIYAPAQKSTRIPYMMSFLRARIGGSLASIATHTPVVKSFRSFVFNGNTSQLVMFYYSPPGCLRILDPARAYEYPDIPIDLREAAGLSRLDLILPDAQPAARPPQDNFKPEPAHDWCYGFEKADLARQQNDWAKVVSVGDPLLARADLPAELTEMGVFIEGYARSGQMKQALDWSTRVLNKDPKQTAFVCGSWHYFQEQNAVSNKAASSALKQLQCSP